MEAVGAVPAQVAVAKALKPYWEGDGYDATPFIYLAKDETAARCACDRAMTLSTSTG